MQSAILMRPWVRMASRDMQSCSPHLAGESGLSRALMSGRSRQSHSHAGGRASPTLPPAVGRRSSSARAMTRGAPPAHAVQSHGELRDIARIRKRAHGKQQAWQACGKCCEPLKTSYKASERMMEGRAGRQLPHLSGGLWAHAHVPFRLVRKNCNIYDKIRRHACTSSSGWVNTLTLPYPNQDM